MEHVEKPVINQHVSGFEAGDMFFSRTDARGVIRSGNEVFVRLSEYEWSDLKGAPHRIIRHPDMPKAVFHLMWRMLKEGKAFGGYVKNRTSTGKYYWVFAVITPTEDGFLSVRIKPATQAFDAVRHIYRKLRENEKRNGFNPESAEEMILSHLAELGYDTYEQFMTEALSQEIDLRTDLKTNDVGENLRKLSTIGRKILNLQDNVTQVNELFNTIQNVPINLNLAGARQGETGRAIQVVASNYTHISNELMQSIKEMDAGLDTLITEARRLRMGYCSAVVLADAITKFIAEKPTTNPESHEKELAIVHQAFQSFLRGTKADCEQIAREAVHFTEMNTHLRKHLSALSVTRVICRIEAAALINDTGSIDEIADRLDAFQIQLSKLLDKIATDSDMIAAAVPNLTSGPFGHI